MIVYIFLNAQMNPETNEILTLGALGCSKSFTPKRQFNAVLKPTDMKSVSDLTIDRMGLSRQKLKSARERSEVADAFYRNFFTSIPKEGHQYIVWDRETVQHIERFMRAYGYDMPKHDIISMQDIFDFIDYKASEKNDLSYYMYMTNFDYKKYRLCESAYIIDIMSDFYMYVRSKLFEYAHDNHICVIKAKGSRIFHKDECRYSGRILDENVERISVARIMEGLMPCKCCSTDISWRKELFEDLDLRRYTEGSRYRTVKGIKVGAARDKLNIIGSEFKAENIETVCNYFKFNFKIGLNTVEIRTAKASWIIKHDNANVDVLLHENWDLRPEKNVSNRTNMKFDAKVAGYHNQNVGLSSLVDVCEYIYKHDNNPNAYKVNKHARLSALFEMISKVG